MGRRHKINNLDLWLSHYTDPGAQCAFEDDYCRRGLECTVSLFILLFDDIKILIQISKPTVHSRPLPQQPSSKARCAPG